MTLVKGQEDLKVLLGKEKLKKKKKRTGVVTFGRRFENEAIRVLEFPSASEEETGKGKGAAPLFESEAEK